MQLLGNLGQNRLSVTFFAGLLLRLVCMPFCAHSDLLSMYWRSHIALNRGSYSINLSPAQVLHDLFLWLQTPLLSSPDVIWPSKLNVTLPLALSQIENWALVIGRPQIYRALFLFKVPYLLFDLGCLVVLFYMFRREHHKRFRALSFWWLNPILIFSTYVFSRFDVVALFFVLLSLLLFQKNRFVGSLLLLGAGIILRLHPIFLLPFYIFTVAPISWKTVKLFAAGILCFLVLELASQFSGGYSRTVQLANWSYPHHFLLAAQLPVSSWDTIYLFPLFYFLLLLHCMSNTNRNYHNLQRYGLVCLLLLFATAASGQSPHYWTWFIPFLTLVVVEDDRLKYLSYLQFILLLVYSFIGGRSTAGYLFASISPDFFWSLPNPAEIIGQHVPIETFISLARTALSAVTLWMAYLAFRQVKTNIPLYPGAKSSK